MKKHLLINVNYLVHSSRNERNLRYLFKTDTNNKIYFKTSELLIAK